MSASLEHPSRRAEAVARAVRELEQHVAAGGWDAPVRLFALVRTARALSLDPSLTTQLPSEVVQAARADAEHLTAVEQEELPESESLEALLGRVCWPGTVDGAASTSASASGGRTTRSTTTGASCAWRPASCGTGRRAAPSGRVTSTLTSAWPSVPISCPPSSMR